MIMPQPRLYERIIRGAIISALLLAPFATIRAQDLPAENRAAANFISGKVLTRDGEPLGNARIAIGRLNTGSTSQGVRLEGSGAFKTEPLEPGLYWLSVYAPGFITDTSQATNSPGYYRPGDSVTFTMIKGGVITGTVKNSNDEPAIAISVRAIRVRDQEGKPLQLTAAYRERLTDDRGVYRLYGLPPGTYIVSAGGTPRPAGSVPPTAYESLAPTYAPSSTRDTAVEIPLGNGDEANVDIQFRGDAGHAIGGSVAGMMTFEGNSSWSAVVSLFDVRNHAEVASTSASSVNKFVFALYGVPDGEYELYASQGSPSGDQFASAPKQIKIQGSDVTGINLAVTPLASIDGRVIFESDPKAPCGKRRASTILETMVYARRYQPERNSQSKDAPAIEVPFPYRNSARQATVDANGSLNIKNVQAGTYRIDPREPASGWYVKSIAIGPATRNANVARDGLTVRSGERVSGLTITIAEGASQLVGKISLAEGQSLSPGTRVYLAPAERENAENVLRFHEARPETNRSFTIDNISPGKYLIIARRAEENEYGAAKLIRLDAAFRTKILQDAQAIKKEIMFKPCEQTFDYELPLASTTSPQ